VRLPVLAECDNRRCFRRGRRWRRLHTYGYFSTNFLILVLNDDTCYQVKVGNSNCAYKPKRLLSGGAWISGKPVRRAGGGRYSTDIDTIAWFRSMFLTLNQRLPYALSS